MATFTYLSYETYSQNGASANYTALGTPTDQTADITDVVPNTVFDLNEAVASSGTIGGPGDTFTFAGTIDSGGQTLLVINDGNGTVYVFSPLPAIDTTFPGTLNTTTTAGNVAPGGFIPCFTGGTLIATPDGETAVESLQIGDRVLTASGRTASVRWVGHRTINPVFAGPASDLVCICAGALGNGLPHTDLTLTADHGMIIDNLVVNAGVLVNGGTIHWVPLSRMGTGCTVYHVETEDHDVIIANGAPAETFIDYVGRKAFDNHAEYAKLYGAERIIPEMSTPRISSQRLLPDAIRARLGISDDGIECDKPLSEQALSA